MRIYQKSKFGIYADYLQRSDTDSEVSMGEVKRNSHKLWTFGVASCVVMAVYNQSSGQGILGHFSSISPTSESNPFLSNEEFDGLRFLETVESLPELGPLSQTEIWLGGVALYQSEKTAVRQSKLADRLHAENIINKLFIAQGIATHDFIVDWNQEEYDLYVDFDILTASLLVQHYID